jgi:hypothetical protein
MTTATTANHCHGSKANTASQTLSLEGWQRGSNRAAKVAVQCLLSMVPARRIPPRPGEGPGARQGWGCHPKADLDADHALARSGHFEFRDPFEISAGLGA